MSFVVEPEKKVPVIYDVDVAVAGGGVSGVFAALAAARNGAETVLIDRFGTVGGNIGPGMILGGSLTAGSPHVKAGYNTAVYRGFTGIPKEFIERYASLGGGSLPPYNSQSNFPRDCNVASYLALKMLEEAGVNLMLSTYEADPILEGNRVCGLFVENKSGRQAVKAKVVIDATGEADVARRAGAPILYPKTSYHSIDGHAPTGMGLSYILGGVDWEKYEAFKKSLPNPSEEDIAWSKETLGYTPWEGDRHLIPLVKKAWTSGEYKTVEEHLQKIMTPIGWYMEWSLSVTTYGLDGLSEYGLASGGMAPARIEELNIGDGVHISNLEANLRMLVFESVQFWKTHVPGFENSFLICIAPFLGARGGPCIEGEYTLTMDDCKAGRRFNDVMYLYGEFRALRYTCETGECKWVDFPYRVMLPKKIDGLLAVGRSASGIPDTLVRNRMAAMHMGQAGGTAAALAAKKGITPKELDVKELQRALLDAGFYLGDRARLKELGLI